MARRIAKKNDFFGGWAQKNKKRDNARALELLEEKRRVKKDIDELESIERTLQSDNQGKVRLSDGERLRLANRATELRGKYDRLWYNY